MNKTATRISVLLILSAIVGCSYPSNNEPAPASTKLRIVSPTYNSSVDGVVTVSLDGNTIGAKTFDFYVDGGLMGTAATTQWTWNTASLPSNTYHTLKVIGHNDVNSYVSTDDVVVKIVHAN